jgi:hypothetical protein
MKKMGISGTFLAMGEWNDIRPIRSNTIPRSLSTPKPKTKEQSISEVGGPILRTNA